MSREVTIVTPENIPLTLELAGLGARFAALGIDLVLQAALLLMGLTLLSYLSAVTRLLGTDYLVSAVAIVYSFLVFTGYYMLLETLWSGQTVGKRALGLRVVRDGGYPITFFSAATRNLIRIADFIPLNYGVGATVVFLNPQYKRLGDLIAGTVVIKEREARFLRAFAVSRSRKAAVGGDSIADEGEGLLLTARRPKYSGPRLPDTAREPLDVLTEEEIALLRRFAGRRWEMTPDDAERLAYRLAVPLIERLNILFVPHVPPRYADLITVIVGTADLTAAEREEAAGVRL